MILVAKELNRELPRIDFEQSGTEEHGADADAHRYAAYLELDPDAGGPMDDLLGHSITYRVTVGPRAGQKVFSLQTVPARAGESRKGAAQYAGFSVHAGIGVEAEQREKLERLARYVSRPPVAVERLDLTAQGQVRSRRRLWL